MDGCGHRSRSSRDQKSKKAKRGYVKDPSNSPQPKHVNIIRSTSLTKQARWRVMSLSGAKFDHEPARPCRGGYKGRRAMALTGRAFVFQLRCRRLAKPIISSRRTPLCRSFSCFSAILLVRGELKTPGQDAGYPSLGGDDTKMQRARPWVVHSLPIF